MGQVTPPVSAASQQLNSNISAVTDSSGNATFTFASPPVGSIYTGTLTCGAAPETATFFAVIGATSWGSWGGSSVYGPVQAFANEQLVVTAEGLTPNTTYEMVWLASSDPVASVGVIYPDANSSVVASTLTGTIDTAITNAGVGTVVYPLTGIPTSTGSVALSGVPLPTATRTLIIIIQGAAFGSAPGLIVQGSQSLFTYYDGFVYLYSGGNYMAVMSVMPSLDNSFSVNVSGATQPSTVYIEITGDTVVFDESILYNGMPSTDSWALTTTTDEFIPGPLRLLSVSIESYLTNTNGTFSATYSGDTLLRVQAGTTGEQVAALTFPWPGLKIPKGNDVVFETVMGGAGAACFGACSFAFP